MAWIEAHQELLNHPKTAELAHAMNWNKFEAVGRLFAFWWWALQYAATGDLRKYSECQIGVPVELSGGDANRFVEAMVQACWLDRADGIFRVHDWPDYTKRYLRDAKFKDKPQKWREVLRVYDIASREPAASNSGVTPEFSAVPNQPTDLTNQPGEAPAGGTAKPAPAPPAPPAAEPDAGPELKRAARLAFDQWSGRAPPSGRGYPLVEHEGEVRKVFALVDLLAEEAQPIVRGAEAIPQKMLVAQCVEMLAKRGNEFRDVSYAVGTVRAELRRWAANGEPARGAAVAPKREPGPRQMIVYQGG